MRKFITSLAAAAVTLTSFSAVPAAAGDRNFERFVIGAGTILLLNELHKGGHANVHHNKHRSFKQRHHRKHYNRHGRKHVGKHRRSRLPRACLISVRKHHRWVQAYSQRCLRRHGY